MKTNLITPQVISRVRDILRVKGNREIEMVPCIFHEDTAPSLAVYFTPGDEHIHCFGCGKHLSFISLIMEAENKEFIEVLQEFGLAKNPHQEIFWSLTRAAQKVLEEDGVVLVDEKEVLAKSYLTEQRGIPAELISRFRIGCVSSLFGGEVVAERLKTRYKMSDLERSGLFQEGAFAIQPGYIIFPLLNRGEPHAFIYRTYGEDKKFKRTHRTKWLSDTVLWNQDALRHSERVFICEGIEDALSIIAQGEAAVATLGAQVSQEQKEKLAKSGAGKFIVSFDADSPGRKGAGDLIRFLKGSGKEVGEYVPLQGKDANEEIRQGVLDVLGTETQHFSKFEDRDDGIYKLQDDSYRRISNFTFSVEGLSEPEAHEKQLLIHLKVANPVFLKETDGEVYFPLPISSLSEKRQFMSYFLSQEVVQATGPGSDFVEYLQDKATAADLPYFFDLEDRGCVDIAGKKLFVGSNGAFDSDGRFYDGLNGLLEVGGTRISLVREYGEPKIEVVEPQEQDFGSLIDFFQTFNPSQKVVLAWALAAPFAEQIYRELAFFPILWVWGEQGAGKSTFLSYIQGLFTRIRTLKQPTGLMTRVEDSSPEGWARRLSSVVNLPIIIDDFRAGMYHERGLFSLARSVYDRTVGVKGTIRSKQKTGSHRAVEERHSKSVLAFTSQGIPRDPALQERCLLVEFSKDELNLKQEQAFRATFDTLLQFGYSVVRAALQGKQILRPSDREWILATTERREKNIRFIEAVIKHFFGKRHTDAVRQHLTSQLDEMSDQDDWFRFLKLTEDLLNKSYVERGIHFGMVGGKFWIAIGPTLAEVKKHLRDEEIPQNSRALGRLAAKRGGTEGRVYIHPKNGDSMQVRVRLFPPTTPTGKILAEWCGELVYSEQGEFQNANLNENDDRDVLSSL